MSEVTGSGVGVLPLDFRVVFEEDAYLRMLPRGAPADNSGIAGGRGRATDLYWYGLSIGAADGILNGVTGGLMTRWGSAGNPWVLQTTSPSFLWYKGAGESNTTAAYPVFSYSAPKYAVAGDFTSASVMNLKYGFFGDIVVCNVGTPTYGSTSVCGGRGYTNGTQPDGSGRSGVLRSISVWDGFSVHGSQYSIFQSTVDYGKYTGAAGSEFKSVNTSNGSALDDSGTFGFVWLNRINSAPTGEFRFAAGGGANPLVVPKIGSSSFSAQGGLYMTNLDINMPIGHLHYQPLIFDNQGSGNLVIELVRIPDNSGIYNYAYRDYADSSAAQLAKMCTNATVDCTNATHGELKVGEISYRTNSGIQAFGSAGIAGTAASVAVEGIFLQHLKIQTLGL